MLKEKLTELIGQDLTDAQLATAVETAIANYLSYDHEAPSGANACKIDGDVLESKWSNFDMEETNFSRLVEYAENTLSKREMSFLFIAQTIELAKSPLERLLNVLSEEE